MEMKECFRRVAGISRSEFVTPHVAAASTPLARSSSLGSHNIEGNPPPSFFGPP